MKYVFIVKEGFTDKYTDEKYEIGKVLTVDEARGEELKKVPELVEFKKIIEDKIEEPKVEEEPKTDEEPKVEEEPKTDEEPKVEEDKEIEELKEKAKGLGIKVTNKMKKETILEKIAEIENAEKEE